MKIFQASSFWWFSFTLMFFLSLDFWHWEQPVKFFWLNLPPWVFYFIGLQITLTIALIVFALKFWPTSRDEKQER
ncbi:hypothetical protein [Pleurocapsa sp. PCC 7319]|uniref:hypothetical protein n=1 Tax=Pleurocapsa sp. PCC 7319 TaxID=118161 RepID=UPI0003641F5C|nr:hypothetical protein [Pleurocapsa sp. PCC 7319]